MAAVAPGFHGARYRPGPPPLYQDGDIQMTTTCVHHWMVDPPIQGQQQASCKLCGDHTVFRPVYGGGTYDATTPIAARLSAEVGPRSVGRRAV